MNYIGIDVGGTKILASQIFPDFKIGKSIKIPTHARLSDDIIVKEIEMVVRDLKTKDTEGIGISWAGLIDNDQQTIKSSPHIKAFREINLKKKLEKTINQPILINNDSQCFAIAEQRICYPKSKTLLGITIGTGVGGGIIFDGKLFGGSQHFAGEIGHQFLEGKPIEAYFAGQSLENLFHQSFPLIINQSKDILYEKIKPSLYLFSQWIYNLILTLNPDTIVFGGSVGILFWSSFLPEINQQLKKRFQSIGLPIRCKLKKSSLKNAGGIGAVILLREKFDI